MRKLMIAILVAATAACWSDKVTGSSTVFGTYTLRSVNGSSLPATVSTSGADKSEIVADTIWLYEGFTFAESSYYRNTVSGTTTNQKVTDSGAFSLLGNSASFFSNKGTPVQTYVIDADVINVVKPGLTMPFRKL